METILIATDFSSAARNATLYGFELARQIGAKVILFTVYQVPAVLPDSAFYVAPEELEKESYKQLLEEAEALDPKRTVLLETQNAPGPVNRSILTAASNNHASYIVVGMKEWGKELKKYFGTTVTQLYKTSTIPLIVVPADATFSAPETIALASDITADTDIHVLDPLKAIAEEFGSNIYVVRVIKKSMDEMEERTLATSKLNLFFAPIEHDYKFIKAENVAKALNVFVEQKAVKMVAVIPHEHDLLERIFSRSVTKDLVFKSKVPLLILPDRNIAGKTEEAVEYNESKFSYNIY